MSREISKGTKDYADNILAGLEVALEDALKIGVPYTGSKTLIYNNVLMR